MPLTINPAPTYLTLVPAGGVTVPQYGTYTVTLEAILRSQVTNAALVSRPVTFTTAIGPTCTAYTNSNGLAACNVTITDLGYFSQYFDYSASYPGSINGDYLGSTVNT